MKILAIIAISGFVESASARNVEVNTAPKIPVCVEAGNTGIALTVAKGLASRMFAAAGVTIKWRNWNGCPDSGIRVSVSEATSESDHPDAYGYATPYDYRASRVVIFWDRIVRNSARRSVSELAAHVLVHELTHILEGMHRHSDSGVMKAIFSTTDIAEMDFHPLPFTEEDLRLIRLGIERRQTRLAQALAPLTALSRP